MASMAGAENALEVRLAELETFGLGRPANVLFTEYVAVLVDRGIIDAATAEQLSLAFHSAHYGALDTEEPSFLATMARLQDVTDQLGAMPAEARRELADRVQSDLHAITGSASRTPRDNGSFLFEPRRAALLEAADTYSAPTPWETSYADPGLAAPAPERGHNAGWRRRGALQLIVMIPAAAGLVFAGYASHDRINQILESRGFAVEQPRRDRERPRHGNPRVIEQREWEISLWTMADREYQDSLAERQFQNAHAQKAKFAYELLLKYRPDDPPTLNALAWLYLTTHDPAVHNPERGLELGKRVIKLQRAANYLDTAAEGYFQTGDPEEAVKLETEALSLGDHPFSFLRPGSSMAFMQGQLIRFRNALAAKRASGVPPSPGASKPAAAAPSGTSPSSTAPIGVTPVSAGPSTGSGSADSAVRAPAGVSGQPSAVR